MTTMNIEDKKIRTWKKFKVETIYVWLINNQLNGVATNQKGIKEIRMLLRDHIGDTSDWNLKRKPSMHDWLIIN